MTAKAHSRYQRILSEGVLSETPQPPKAKKPRKPKKAKDRISDEELEALVISRASHLLFGR